MGNDIVATGQPSPTVGLVYEPSNGMVTLTIRTGQMPIMYIQDLISGYLKKEYDGCEGSIHPHAEQLETVLVELRNAIQDMYGIPQPFPPYK